MAKRLLKDLRAAINTADSELLDILNRRARLAMEVGEIKAESAHSQPYYVPERERQIIDHLQAENQGPFPDHAVRPVFQEIISACLSLESALRVAYLGPEATFTHQAVKRHFGTSAISLPCGSISAVFSEVTRGSAEYGVIPVENSTEGVVTHTLDSFVDTNLTISAEIVVGIEQCLLASGGVSLRDIERVYSHPQALAQCREWLQNNLPRVALLQTASTADAAQSLVRDSRGAAVCAELAARVYNLSVLRSGIQDAQGNITRFLVVSSQSGGQPAASGQDKTSVLLVLPDTAGALLDILAPLSDAGINLTKIESRPTRRRAWDYVFFLDLDGHISEPHVAKVCQILAAKCQLFKVLGSYQKADLL